MTVLLAALLAARVLTLEEALETAAKNQPQLQQAHALTLGAEARADQARSGLLPQVSASAAFQHTGNHGYGGTAGSAAAAGVNISGNTFSDSVSASQLLFDFGSTTGQWKAQLSAAEAQQFTERETRSDVALNLRTAFFNARAQKSLVAVAQETLANQERHLEQTRGFVEVGTHPEIELAQARANVANARVQLINALNNYDIAKATLNQAMGVEGSLDYDVSDQGLPVIQLEDSPTDAAIQEAVQARPDVRSLEASIRAERYAVSAARGGYGPAIGATAGIAQAGPALDDLGWRWTAGVTATWQIFQGGLTNALVREAQAAQAQAEAQLATLKLQLRVDVQNALLSVKAAKSTITAAQDALIAARDQLRLAEGRFETGVGNEIELSDAQVTVTNAAAQAVQADQRLATARAQLLRALGREETK